MNLKYTILLFAFILGLSNISKGQTDVTLENCTKHFGTEYISDGQQYKALLSGGEIAEFHTTFYADNHYRIVGATGKDEGNVIFSIYDQENNLLFTNRDHKNSPYWDFKFENSMNCTIEAKLNQKNISSGFVLMLIGFKQ
ncbi:hypothetical protein GCQ56_12265 [Marinifilum sp. N1E240]|uniref:hypothetical protein n=1 Tax=Marinifilum sp. N1E240 TaxID=2608082 RepID=UPI00128CDED7|nr:hypothetical protein [Marinifilum sp. N1E240]MPQ47776.1 hypothetical protein [Marinifilum sp. N1E240]